MSTPFLYAIPFWLWALLLVVLLIGTTEVGYRIGLRRAGPRGDAGAADGNVVLGSMLALVGLVIAFTYSFTVSRYEARKSVVVDEANALGSIFRVADLAPEPARSDLMGALLDYARTRVVTSDNAGTPELAEALIAQDRSRPRPGSGRSPRASWRRPAPAPTGWPSSRASTSCSTCTRSGSSSAFDRLPQVVLLLLLLLVGTSLALAGYDAGVSGKRARLRLAALAAVLASVIVVVTDFDRTAARVHPRQPGQPDHRHRGDGSRSRPSRRGRVLRSTGLHLPRARRGAA